MATRSIETKNVRWMKETPNVRSGQGGTEPEVDLFFFSNSTYYKAHLELEPEVVSFFLQESIVVESTSPRSRTNSEGAYCIFRMVKVRCNEIPSTSSRTKRHK